MFIEFLEEPFQDVVPGPACMGSEMVAVCDSEVSSLLTKGAILPVDDAYASVTFLPSLKVHGVFDPLSN